MDQWVKGLGAKPNNLSLIPEPMQWKSTPVPVSCPLISTCAPRYVVAHTYMHIYKQKGCKCKKQNKNKDVPQQWSAI